MTTSEELHAKAQRAYTARLKAKGYKQRAIFVKPEGLEIFNKTMEDLRKRKIIL
tara:strand:- start:306 stop:467 length:162 start_codon:yes stop_codon:yes gene_type:complete